MAIAESLNLSLKSFISASFSPSLFVSAFSIVDFVFDGGKPNGGNMLILMGSSETWASLQTSWALPKWPDPTKLLIFSWALSWSLSDTNVKINYRFQLHIEQVDLFLSFDRLWFKYNNLVACTLFNSSNKFFAKWIFFIWVNSWPRENEVLLENIT